jgi:hypothetical protein
VQALVDKGLASKEELMLKLNFSDFIRRFERENMNIIEFGSAQAYDRKIQTIREKLMQYADELIKSNGLTV